MSIILTYKPCPTSLEPYRYEFNCTTRRIFVRLFSELFVTLISQTRWRWTETQDNLWLISSYLSGKKQETVCNSGSLVLVSLISLFLFLLLLLLLDVLITEYMAVILVVMMQRFKKNGGGCLQCHGLHTDKNACWHVKKCLNAQICGTKTFHLFGEWRNWTCKKCLKMYIC